MDTPSINFGYDYFSNSRGQENNDGIFENSHEVTTDLPSVQVFGLSSVLKMFNDCLKPRVNRHQKGDFTEGSLISKETEVCF
jgi:hypothetical protein